MAPRVRNGVHAQFEALADELIFGSLQGVTSREAKSDILTPWKEKHRKSHEIMTRSGAPVDAQVRRGNFHRAYNPVHTHLNSYEGATRAMKLDSNWDAEQGEPVQFLSSEMAQAVGLQRMDG